MHSGEKPIIGLTKRLLNQPARYLYKLEYANHEQDASKSLEQTLDALTFALNSPLLPSHQFTSASEYVYRSVHNHMNQRPSVDEIIIHVDHFGRSFAWEYGDPLPIGRSGIPDKKKILARIQSNQSIDTLSIFSSFDPKRGSNISFMIKNIFVSKHELDLTTFTGILFKKRQDSDGLIEEELPYMCKTMEISGVYKRHTFSKNMSTLSILGTEGWTSLYYVGDFKSQALYFCTIDPRYSGRKRPTPMGEDALAAIHGLPQTT